MTPKKRSWDGENLAMNEEFLLEQSWQMLFTCLEDHVVYYTKNFKRCQQKLLPKGSKKETHLPTIHFLGAMLVSGRIIPQNNQNHRFAPLNTEHVTAFGSPAGFQETGYHTLDGSDILPPLTWENLLISCCNRRLMNAHQRGYHNEYLPHRSFLPPRNMRGQGVVNSHPMTEPSHGRRLH